jgi:predicted nucleic acid-binding protein
MTLVADFGALYALYDADDDHHEAVQQIVAHERGSIIVPTAILSEIGSVLKMLLCCNKQLI